MHQTSSPIDYKSLMKDAVLKLDELQSRLKDVERTTAEPIAIIGMSCRFPGGADTPEAFWELLREGRSTSTEIPRSRWDLNAYYDADPDARGKIYSRHGSFLEQIDHFDAPFFGISPREAAQMDPQQRLLLETAWEALECAGIRATRLSGSRTGVMIGVMNHDYAQFSTQFPDAIDVHTGAGTTVSVVAGRLSYILGLQGPSLVVDTACSSSLVSVHLACRSLRYKECDLALAGGVNAILSPVNSVIESRTRILSTEGRCKTFDASADGIVRGEGCGMVVLKRLSDALASGDPILALIRGSAVNHDGRTSALSVPNGPSQEAVIRQALADARVSPGEVGYVEAHGTATPLGDPIEVEALGAVFGPTRPASSPLLLGSVKTNLGHLEGAAGIAGLIKVVLSLQHEEIPAHLHLTVPSPLIAWDTLPIRVTSHNAPWPRGERKRLAGVSSFGFSGTNAHVVLEEAPEPASVTQSIAQGLAQSMERDCHLVALSALSERALSDLAHRYADYARRHEDASLADVCFTANTGRVHFPAARLAIVAASLSQLADRLERFSRDAARDQTPPKIAFCFTGQGSQYAGMGRALYASQPVFRETFDRCDALLRPILHRSLTEFFDTSAATDAILRQTQYTQPALFALEYALAAVWQSWGVKPAAVMGYSSGEYVAACVAGVLALEDAVKLVAARARLMQALPEGGAMIAVAAPAGQVLDLIARCEPEVAIASLNGAHTVISGRAEALNHMAVVLEEAGARTTPLPVSHAFHSPLMDPVLAPFEAIASGVAFHFPGMCVISNVTGQPAGPEIATAAYWARQIRQPVQFDASLEAMAKLGINVFLEIGPAPALIAMGRHCLPNEGLPNEGLPNEDRIWLASLRPHVPDWQQMLSTLGQLYTRGVDIEWEEFDRRYARRKLMLPTYPFQRRRYWIDTQGAEVRNAPIGEEEGVLLGARKHSAALKSGEVVFSTTLSADRPAFLNDHRVFGIPVLPASAYVEMALSAAAARLPHGNLAIEDLNILQALPLSGKERRTVEHVLVPNGPARYQYELHSFDSDQEAWTLHASAKVGVGVDGAPTWDLAAARAECTMELDVEEHTRRCRESGIEYGPSFRAVKRLWRGPGVALCEAALPEPVDGDAEKYRLHPALLDACFQVFLAAFPDPLGDLVYLPAGIDRLRLFRPGAGRLWSYGRVRPRAGQETALRADLWLVNDDGALVAQVEGFSVRGARREILLQALHGASNETYYRVNWQATPIAELRPAVAGRWLVLAGRDDAGHKLAQRLKSQGAECVLVSHDEGIHPEQLARGWNGVVNLWPLDVASQKDQRLGCGSTLDLIQAILRSTREPPRLWLVTRGAQQVTGADSLAVFQAPVWGLFQTLMMEHPELHCAAVDLDPVDRAGDVSALLQELGGSDERHIAYRQGVRQAARLGRADLIPSGTPALCVRPDASYLITGGLGGLGLLAAEWLVEQGARHVVQLGRSARLAASEPRPSGSSHFTTFVQADVADPQAMASVLATIEPPLAGVVHCAGVLEDGVLLNQTWQSFERVMAPKINGAWNLHELTRNTPLDFFVCFSSVASMTGSPGQGNYAASNAFLDALAQHRRAIGLPGLSVNWGSWDAGGMTVRVKHLRRSRSPLPALGTLTPERAFRVLGQLLEQNLAQAGVFTLDWAEFFRSFPSLARVPFFADCVPAENPAPAGFLAGLHRHRPEDWADLLETHVAEQVGKVLQLEPSEVPRTARLFDLGLDSLTAVELKNSLAASLGCSLRSTLAFDYPTTATLAAHLHESISGTTRANGRAHSVELSQILEDVKELSDHQIEQLVEQELRTLLVQESTLGGAD